MRPQIQTLSFPDDHGPHPEYRLEWWYLTGSLQDTRGHLYGVQFTAFRYAISPPVAAPGLSPPTNPWRTSQVYIAHLALSDATATRHYEDQRLVRAHPKLAGAQRAAVCRLGRRLDAKFGR